MALSRKHYEAIAAILASNNFGTDPETMALGFDNGYATGRAEMLESIANDLADYVATDNPNFNRERFLKAAGVN